MDKVVTDVDKEQVKEARKDATVLKGLLLQNGVKGIYVSVTNLNVKDVKIFIKEAIFLTKGNREINQETKGMRNSDTKAEETFTMSIDILPSV